MVAASSSENVTDTLVAGCGMGMTILLRAVNTTTET
jgi:hypothetical protein